MKFKKKNKPEEISEELKIKREYNGYSLDHCIRKYIPWKTGNFMVKENEEVIFAIYYRNSGNAINDGRTISFVADNKLLVYLVKDDTKFKLKYLDWEGTEEKAEKIAQELITNLGMYQLLDTGYGSKQFKDYIRNEKMVETDIEEDIYFKIKELGNINYDKLDYFSYVLGNESIDYYDYVNKKYFYCDEYCPEIYKPCVKVVEELIKKCNIVNLKEVNIKFFIAEDETKIMRKLLDEAKEDDSLIL